jgi:SOS-response transcriptional repressor LexA
MANDAERREREDRAERLKWAREHAGFRGPSKPADLLKMSVNTVKAHEAGRNGFGLSDARSYARLYKVSTRWLYLNQGLPDEVDEVDTAPIAAPLISWVSAGALIAPDVPVDDDSYAIILREPGLDPRGDWIALRVEGDSMYRVSPHGSIIFVNRKSRKLIARHFYVIGDGEGGATYKRFMPPNTWEPYSTNPKHEAFVLKPGQEPDIIGRVEHTKLNLIG